LTLWSHQVIGQLPQIKPDRFIQHRIIHANKEQNLNGSSFDFIVVGAGSAGCVLSKRLSENPSATVLVLEAGPPDNYTEIAAPSLFSQLFKSGLDWNYQSKSENSLDGSSVYIPRGKVVGGSSSLNAMIVNRGSDKLYDLWDYFLNLDGWKWDDVLPFFMKSQKYLDADIDTEFQSSTGEWKQRSPPFRFNITTTIVDHFKQNNYFGSDDSHQNGVNNGFNFHTVNMDEMSRRHSLADAFLTDDVLQRENLYVRPFSHITKVVFSEKVCFVRKCCKSNPIASGVQFKDSVTGQVYTVHAKKEVILSAGAINTPHILMVSGIGSKKQLKKHGIKVIKDLPGVGQNLQDHPLVGMTYNITSSNFETLETALTGESFVQWLTTGTGAFGTNINEGISYEKSKFNKRYFGLADVKLAIAPGVYVKDGFVTFPPPTKGFSFGVELVNAQSKGQITLKSADPFVYPEIQTNILKDKRDLQLMVETFEHFRDIFLNDPFFESFVDDEILPGKNVTTKKQLIKYLKEYTGSGYHSCCTVKMGEDRMGVLDNRLRVKGVDRLRVVDASVFPVIPSANTNGPTVMAAEKGSHMILEDHDLL